jgi:hypothetical protein
MHPYIRVGRTTDQVLPTPPPLFYLLQVYDPVIIWFISPLELGFLLIKHYSFK